MKSILLTTILCFAAFNSLADEACTVIPKHQSVFFNDKTCISGLEFVTVFTSLGSEIFDKTEEAFNAGSIACKTNEEKFLKEGTDTRVRKAFTLGCKNPKYR